MNRQDILTGRKVLLIVTAGIAAYKSCQLVREIIRSGGDVRVIMTSAATEFVNPLTFATLSGHPVLTDLFPENAPGDPVHLESAQWGDILVIAPATANFLAKMAHGLADDLASCIAVAFTGKIIAAPAMNSNMWSNPAVQANIALLESRGIVRIGPEAGEMGGVHEQAGVGRMAEPVQILERIEEILENRPAWNGKKVIVTSGPTREPIDPVRFVSNHSSGMMGDAIARQAAVWGAKVTLIRGSGAVGSPPRGVEHIVAVSASQMAAEVKNRFNDADVLIMTAAVADWTVSNVSPHKLKKDAGMPDLVWEKTEDILAWAGENKTHQAVVGFALETRDHMKGARKKLIEKKADIIALNDPTQSHSAFGGDSTQLTMMNRNEEIIELPACTKRQAAMRLLEETEQLLTN